MARSVPTLAKRSERVGTSVNQICFEESGNYRISWAMVRGAWIYTAWVRQTWHAFSHAPLAMFGEGTNEERLQAARMACREHWQAQREANGGTG